MSFKRDVFTKCALLKRNILFWIIYILNFFLLAACDNKTFFVTGSYGMGVYRCVYQQVIIVFTCIFIVHMIFNENELIAIKDYKIIYTKSAQHEIRSSACTTMIVLVSGFICGQFLAMIINSLLGGRVYIGLLLVNMAVVSTQIAFAVFFIMGLRMIFIKDIAVYGIYYVFLLASLLSESVYISMPITIKIAGDEAMGYYYSFGKELWIGRLLLLIVAFLTYRIGEKRFCNMIFIKA